MEIFEFFLTIILFGTLGLLVVEKGDKILVSLTGAGLALFLAILPLWGENKDHIIIEGVEDLLHLIEPDLMFIIIGMTLLVGVCSETGIFEWIALKILKASNGNLTKLLLYLCILTLIFASFLDAYMAILIIGTITIVSSNGLYYENGDPINPRPFLLAEAFFANIGGMLTRVASPPNLILGSHFNISFFEFSLVMFPLVFASALVSYFILKFIFRKELNQKISDISIKRLQQLDESQVIRERRLFNRAALLIILTVIGFFLSSFFLESLELGYIALAGGFASIALVSGKKADHALKNIEWPIIFFYCGLLTVVGIVEKADLLVPIVEPIENIFGINLTFGLILIIMLNTFFSSFLDNIPMAAIMTNVIDSIKTDLGFTSNQIKPLIWAAVIGTNTGGNITPIASASGVQAVEMLNREKDPSRHVKVFDFIKIGIFLALTTVVLGNIYVLLLANFVYWV